MGLTIRAASAHVRSFFLFCLSFIFSSVGLQLFCCRVYECTVAHRYNGELAASKMAN